MRYFIIAAMIALFALGCSGGSGVNPEIPGAIEVEISATHNLWGLWQFIADPDAKTLDAIQLRSGEMHLNALPFLEPPVNVNLTLDSLQFNGNIIEAEIGLRHPFLGLDEFTGFDVCGIFITNGTSTGYDDADIVMAGASDTWILNPDGYSRWWNPAEFPSNGTILGYTDGMLGAPDSSADYNCTVNAYKYFCDELASDDPVENLDPTGRGIFSAGQKNVRKYIIEMNSGLVFNYAVDACWKFPTGGAPWTVPDDFGENANRGEAYRISVTEISNTLYNDGIDAGGDLHLGIDVYDWFDADQNFVKVESPGNFDTEISASATGGGVGYSTYEIDITDATPTEIGIELLITVECEKTGYGGILPGKSIAHYAKMDVGVDDEVPSTDPIGWARHWGGMSDRGMAAAADSEGSGYSAGWFENYFSDPVDFNPGTGVEEHSSNGNRDIYLSKFDTQGNFLWAHTWGAGSDDEAHGVCVDSMDNVYVTGFFKGTVDFDPGSGVDSHISSGNEDSFVVKLDPDGGFLWAETWGGADSNYVSYHNHNHPYFGDCGFGVAVDDSDNVYVVGTGYDGVGFSYVRKFDSDGNDEWDRKWGVSNFDKAFGVAVYGDDAIYVCGRFDGTVDFDPSPATVNLTAHDAHDSYLAKYDASGNFQWARGWGGNDKHTGYTNPTTHYSDGAYGVAVDNVGNAYVTGEFYGTTDFDPGAGAENHSDLGGDGYGDAYLTVFLPDGDFDWVRVWGGQHFQQGYGIALDATSGTIYVTGRFYNTVDFDPTSGVDNHTSGGDSDSYLTKYDTNRIWSWARTYGGSSYEAGTGVGVDDDANACVTGYFRSTIDFDPGPDVDEHTPNIAEDTYLLKLLANGYWE